MTPVVGTVYGRIDSAFTSSFILGTVSIDVDPPFKQVNSIFR